MKKGFTILFTVVFMCSVILNVPTKASASVGNLVAATQTTTYQTIRAALLKHASKVVVNVNAVNADNIGNLIDKIVEDTPEVLYYKSAVIWSDGTVELNYYVNKTQSDRNSAALNTKIKSVVADIKAKAKTDFEKIKAVHDYLVLHVAYDTNYNVAVDSYTAYGALLKGKAVCDGYTKAAQLLLSRLGIANDYVAGSADGDLHSWNLVKLNGTYYFMDITWDDPIPNKPGKVSYSYFLTTSANLQADHIWDKSLWPNATDTRYRYFIDMENVVQLGSKYYYSSNMDDKIYAISLDGKNKTKVSEYRAPYFVIFGNAIYFSNFSNGGYLYKMTLAGKNVKKLNSIYSVDLNLVGKKLYFVNENTKQKMTMVLSN